MSRPEQELQIAVVSWLDLALEHDKGFFWATPNETGVSGRRGAMLGHIRKQMGVRAGMPDLMVAHQACGYPVASELKSKTGRQPATQKAIQSRFEAIGWPYFICRSVADVEDALNKAGVPIRVKRLI